MAGKLEQPEGFRVTQEESEFITKCCDLLGCSRSEFMRGALLRGAQAYIKERQELAERESNMLRI